MRVVGMARSEEIATYDLYAGNDTWAYRRFGVMSEEDGVYTFRALAPRAVSMALRGDFLADGCLPMEEVRAGVWECTVTSDIPPEGMRYSFLIDGKTAIADPFARRGEWEDACESVICTQSHHEWSDDMWLWHRMRVGREACIEGRSVPLNVYEAHLGSFATREGRSNVGGDAYLNYRELGEILARYLSEMGYTHVKLLPLTEYRNDASHGYAANGFFAPTARHGSPDDLRAMVDRLHRAGIGVWMDLNISSYGEGCALLDLRRGEIRSFLLSCVLFWLREFHLDGLMLCGLRRWWEEGSEMGHEAEQLLRLLNAAVHAEFPDVCLVAGEDVGEMTLGRGMGFDLLHHGRFAEDVIGYLHLPSTRRPFGDDRLRLLCLGAGAEQYLLGFSHAAVNMGHSSLFGQMHGSYLQRFAALRMALAFQMALPGKKMLFMGCELGQLRTWDDTVPPDWYLRELEPHAKMLRFVRALNLFYSREPRLWQCEYLVEDSLIGAGGAPGLFVLVRQDAMGYRLLILLNFSEEATSVRGRSQTTAEYREIFNTDRVEFGGEGRVASGEVFLFRDGCLNREIPPMSAVFLEPISASACEKNAEKPKIS
ncbi:MAG: alpha amylase C-terminal domain-containing protein [Clostridia bacterium]|nr:alpha amylase C-terminal domain-containing protein [Clostridia bacterium]